MPLANAAPAHLTLRACSVVAASLCADLLVVTERKPASISLCGLVVSSTGLYLVPNDKSLEDGTSDTVSTANAGGAAAQCECAGM